MTRDRDIERVLDEFYAEGPSAMPDRLFLGVIDRIERVPQRRLALQMTRFATMTPKFRFALAAAIAVAVVGIGAFALSQRLGVGNQATPSPSTTAAPSPEATVAALSTDLQAIWVGATRTVPQLSPPPTRSVMTLTRVSLQFTDGSPTPRFVSSARLPSPDTLVLTLSSGGSGCTSGDVGTYTVALSGSSGGGGGLSLTPVADPCAGRQAAISGDWFRAVCPGGGWCRGDLDAGAQASVWFNPFVLPTAWTSHVGALSYDVPAGWTNPEDCDGCYQLAKQDAPENTGIYIFDDVVAHSQDKSCPEAAEPGIGRSPTALADWLAGLPGLVATTPAPVTIAGLDGFSLDISVAPGWTHTCPFSQGAPVVGTFSDGNPTGGLDWNVGGEGHTRVILLDLGDGRSLLIDIEAANQADFDALIPEAMQVVNSFQLHP